MEREIAAKECRIGDRRPVLESAETGSYDRLRVHLIGDAKARNEVIFFPVGIGFRQAVEQRVERGIARAGEAPLAGIRKARTWNDDSVIDVAAAGHDAPRSGIDRHSLLGIVKARIEHVVVTPQRVVRLQNGFANAQLELQLGRDLPGVLGVEFVHVAARDGVVAGSDFGVAVEPAEREIGDAGIGCAREARVLEIEPSVLVVRAARNAAHVHLVAVVLSGALIHSAELEGVAAVNPGHVVGVIVDRAAGTRGIRAIVKLREPVDVDGRHLVGDVLGGRAVEVRIIDTVLRALPGRAAQRDVDVVGAGSNQGLID